MLEADRVTQYCGMLVCRAEPKNWLRDEMLLRFVEESNANTVFVVTGAALEQFRFCEPWGIYEFSVSGFTLKTSQGVKKYGVECITKSS